MLIDTHCHVHFNAYKDDMDDVIKRTLDKGVFMITVGTQRDTSRQGLDVASRYDGVFASIGLHPNHLTKQAFVDEQEMIHTRAETFDPAYYRALAKHPKCVAIGECGLDYYRIPEGVDVQEVKKAQETAVQAQFDLASEVDLPVIVHCRDAHEAQTNMILENIEAGKLPRRGVVHCFTGTREEAQRYLDLGFYISFTGVITFPPRKGMESMDPVISSIPLDRILVETDAPYLTPIPHRGERNEPWYVQFVAEKIAKVKRVSAEEVAVQTTANAKKLFHLVQDASHN